MSLAEGAAHQNSAPEFDVIVVGSGAGALLAAIRASDEGLKPLVIEKADLVGGTSALSGGGIWIPTYNEWKTITGTPGVPLEQPAATGREGRAVDPALQRQDNAAGRSSSGRVHVADAAGGCTNCKGTCAERTGRS